MIFAELLRQPQTVGSQQHTIAESYIPQSKRRKHIQNIKTFKIKPLASRGARSFWRILRCCLFRRMIYKLQKGVELYQAIEWKSIFRRKASKPKKKFRTLEELPCERTSTSTQKRQDAKMRNSITCRSEGYRPPSEEFREIIAIDPHTAA